MASRTVASTSKVTPSSASVGDQVWSSYVTATLVWASSAALVARRARASVSVKPPSETPNAWTPG
jgi:hypothetical protein